MSVKYTFKIKNIVYLKINALINKFYIVFQIKLCTFSKSNITLDNFNKDNLQCGKILSRSDVL